MTIKFATYTPEEGGAACLTVFSGGLPHTIISTQENYDKAYQLVVNEKTDDIELVLTLIHPASAVGERLVALSDNITYDGTSILYDGDVLDDGIARYIRRAIEKNGLGDSTAYQSAVAFLEKLYQNPSENSRKALYGYLRRYDFTITPDGDFIAYKGVRKDHRSIHSGPGIVNGVRTSGHLLNEVGSVIAIPRSLVDQDTRVGCSVGLHAGTYAYASGFGQGILLRVKISPRDVVSVPEHCNFQKIRVSKYLVLEANQMEYTEQVYFEDDDEDDEDYFSSGWEEDDDEDDEDDE